MTDNLAQLRWEGCVDQAVQDIRLIVDTANDLYRELCDAERDTASVQYHQFRDDVDFDELIRTANSLKHEIGNRVGSIRDQLARIRDEVGDLTNIAVEHRYSADSRI